MKYSAIYYQTSNKGAAHHVPGDDWDRPALHGVTRHGESLHLGDFQQYEVEFPLRGHLLQTGVFSDHHRIEGDIAYKKFNRPIFKEQIEFGHIQICEKAHEPIPSSTKPASSLRTAEYKWTLWYRSCASYCDTKLASFPDDTVSREAVAVTLVGLANQCLHEIKSIDRRTGRTWPSLVAHKTDDSPAYAYR